MMDVLANDAHGATVIQQGRTDIAATFHKAHDNRVMSLAAEVSRTLGLAGPRQFGFVGLDDLASAAQRADRAAGSHGKANAVAKVPSGFHAAAERPLKLAGRDAFLDCAKQMDRLKPQPQGQMAVLENRADANRERLAAGVALAQAGAGRLARSGGQSGLRRRSRNAGKPGHSAKAGLRRIRKRLPRYGSDRRKGQIWPWLISNGQESRYSGLGMSSETSPIYIYSYFNELQLFAAILSQ